VSEGNGSATISPLGYALLCALHRGPLTGYDLVRKLRRPIGYYWTARQSQIYPELGRLGAAGHIASEGSPGPGPRERKTHRLTDAGRAALAAWLVEPPRDRAPRDELVLKTYALAAADAEGMRALYRKEAAGFQELLDEFTRQHADLAARGGDRPGHPEFGAYATLEYALIHYAGRVRWCAWLADRLGERGAAGSTGD
jgi:DNA-binding PadR family transcriptional regulator